MSKNNSSNYHDEMNGDNFHEWLESIIPRLDANSITVMDNAPYHSVREEKIPTSNWKEEIFSWLTSKGIAIDSKMYKPQLLYQRYAKIKLNTYPMTSMKWPKPQRHSVLRLPPYHYEFNPIELTWAMVKGYVKEHNTTYQIKDVKALMNIVIDRVTSDNWKNFIRYVKTEEDTISAVDFIMDEMIDNLEFCILTVTVETSSDYA